MGAANLEGKNADDLARSQKRSAKGQENREAAQRDAGISGRYQTKQLTTAGGGELLEAAAEHKLVSHLFLNFFKNSTLAGWVKGTFLFLITNGCIRSFALGVGSLKNVNRRIGENFVG